MLFLFCLDRDKPPGDYTLLLLIFIPLLNARGDIGLYKTTNGGQEWIFLSTADQDAWDVEQQRECLTRGTRPIQK